MSNTRRINSTLKSLNLSHNNNTFSNEQKLDVVAASSLNKTKQDANTQPNYKLKAKLDKKDIPASINISCEQGGRLVESYINAEYKKEHPKISATHPLKISIMWGDRMTENMHNLGLAIGFEYFLPNISGAAEKAALFAFYRYDYDEKKGAHINLNLMQQGTREQLKFFLPILNDQKDQPEQNSVLTFAKLDNATLTLTMPPAELTVLRYMCDLTIQQIPLLPEDKKEQLQQQIDQHMQSIKVQPGFLADKYTKSKASDKKLYKYFGILESGNVIQTLFNQSNNIPANNSQTKLNKSDEFEKPDLQNRVNSTRYSLTS